MNDIDLSGIDNFEPIGRDEDHIFRGTFDGQGYTISGLKIYRPSEDVAFAGLFSTLGTRAVVKNLNLRNVDITALSSNGVGAMAGENAGSIINCNAVVEWIEGLGDGVVGGLVGYNYPLAKIINCSVIATGDIQTVHDMVGGLVGENVGLIKGCFTLSEGGDVEESSGYDIYYAGGIAGANWDYGQNPGQIIECYSTCRVSCDWYPGGIVGLNEGGVFNCYYGGSRVYGDRAGGIAGRNDGSVSNCYVSGDVSSLNNNGALVGELNGLISNSFWDIQTTDIGSDRPVGDNRGTVLNCHGKTTEEMRQEETFTTLHNTNWDFENVWVIEEDIGYPKLRSVGDMLPAPTWLSSINGLQDGVHLSWDPVTYEQCGTTHNAVYRVYRSDSADEDAEKVPLAGWHNGCTFIDETAIPNINYYYRVKAAATINGARESEYSISVSGYRSEPPLAAPTNINASDGLPNLTLIEWDAVTNANYYCVYRSTSGVDTKIPLCDWQTSRSYTDNTGAPENTYWYWVKAAVDNQGGCESEFGIADTGYYIAVEQAGSLQVTISPQEAISDGAQWNVDGGPWQSSGTIVSGLSIGDHVVSYMNVADWTEPLNETVTIIANNTIQLSGNYTIIPNQQPSVTIVYPQINQEVSNQIISFDFAGSAYDPDGTVSLVEFRARSGLWQTVTGTTNWTFIVTLEDGDNLVEVRAQDNDGSYSQIEYRTITRTTIIDTDGDGVPDDQDVFPEDPNEWADSDNDGTGDNSDPDDNNPNEWSVPDKPSIIAPDYYVDVPVKCTIEASSFYDADNGIHYETEWEIRDVDANLIVLSLKNGTCLTVLDVPAFVLNPDTSYSCKVRYYDASGNASEWSDEIAFLTELDNNNEINGNGIPDDQEAEYDWDGDGNIDNNVITLSTVLDNGTAEGDTVVVGLVGVENVSSITSVMLLDPSDVSDNVNRPDSLPFGLVCFKVEVIDPGVSAIVDIYLEESAPADARWYKYDEINGWREYGHATFSADGQTVTLELKDGDADFGDIDGVVNYYIVDPSGLGVTETKIVPEEDEGKTPLLFGGGSSGGGKCFIDTAFNSIATISGIGTALFVSIILLGLFGYRKKYKS